MLGRSKQPDYTIGFDIGTHTARAVVTLPQKDNSIFPEIIAVAACESMGLRNGYITHADSAKKTVLNLIAQLRDQSHIDVRKVNVSIGGISVSSIQASGECVRATAADGG